MLGSEIVNSASADRKAVDEVCKLFQYPSVWLLWLVVDSFHEVFQVAPAVRPPKIMVKLGGF